MVKLNDYQKVLFRSIFVFLLFTYSFYLQYIPIYIFKLDTNNLSTAYRVLLSTFSSFITLFIFFFIYRKDLKEEWKIFKKNWIDNMDTAFKYWVLGLIIMMISNLIIQNVFNAGIAANEQMARKMIHSLPYFMILDAGFLAPFIEEIAYRKTIKDAFGNNKWLFVLLSFLLFGYAHISGNPTRWEDYLYIIPYGTLGASFALTYYKTNTIFSSISMHMIHNLILVIINII